MNKSRILVVEDEINQGLLYEQELSDEGYNVDVANSGQAALKLVKENNYNLVVLDIGMAEMDGLETLGRMLSIDNKLPVILNTAYPSYKDNFMSWAADAYVIKSSDLTELKLKIRESLEKKLRLTGHVIHNQDFRFSKSRETRRGLFPRYCLPGPPTLPGTGRKSATYPSGCAALPTIIIL